MPGRRHSPRIPLSVPRTHGALEAEGEHKQHHEQAQETQRRAYEQRDYRCDWIYYVATWMVHLRSPILRWVQVPLWSNERLYEGFAWPVWVGE